MPQLSRNNAINIVPACLAAGFLGLVAVYALLGEAVYGDIVRHFILLPWRFPFFDTHAVLSAVECHAKGINVFVENPCDVFERPFIYAPQWLWLSWFNLDDRHTMAVGILFGLSAIATMAYLMRASADTTGWTAVLLALGTMLSPTVTYALERGNIDLVVFVLAVLIARLLSGPPRQCLLAYGLIVVATLLKFYPILLLALACREPLRRAIATAIVSVIVILVFSLPYRNEILLAFANVPHADWSVQTLGASVLPLGLGRMAPRWGMLPTITWMMLLIGTAVIVLLLNITSFLADQFARLEPFERSTLAVGCFLMAGCFFAGQSYAYRGVFLLLLVPACIRLAPRSLLFQCFGAMVLLLPWQWYLPIPTGTANLALGVVVMWIAVQLVWWLTIAICMGIAVHVVLQSAAAREALTMIVRRDPHPR